jgi:fucose permease
LLLFICYLGFVSLGLPDPLIGVAWPSVRDNFALRQGDVSAVFFGNGCAYLLSSFFAGRLLKLFSVGAILAGSSALVAAAMFDFAFARIWILFAAGALLHGFGSGAIDTGLHHYVTTHFSAKHMNWLHASYSVGAMLGPAIMTAAIARGDSWRLGYGVVGTALLLLALLFFATRARWNHRGPAAHAAEGSAEPAPAVTSFLAVRHPMVVLHILLFFVYVGLEVSLGQWSFTVLTESRGLTPERAGFFVTLYWAGILAGRIAFGFIVERLGIDSLVRLSTIGALAGAALFMWNPFPASAPFALVLAGLGLAAIFPCLMTRTPQRLGPALSVHAIGSQVGAGMIGAAALPSLCGWIAQTAGLAFVAPAIAAFSGVLLVLHETALRMGRSPTVPPTALSTPPRGHP